MLRRAPGSPRSRPVLAGEDLVVDFPLKHDNTLRAVDHVSFQLQAGEVLGIVGESGSGKTTLGRVVAGFLKPTAGQMLFASAGEAGLSPRPAKRMRGYRDVQMIFQESAAALNPRLPVWRLVAEAIAPSLVTAGVSRARTRELQDQVASQLDRVGLPAKLFLGKRPGELSGGEKQRVAIARALAASPVALVCDESVAALDVSIRAVVLNLLERLSAESGIALLFITHDISVVAHLADQIAVMYHGKVVEHGAPRQIIDDPQAEYTRRLIAAVPTLERTLSPASPASRAHPVRGQRSSELPA